MKVVSRLDCYTTRKPNFPDIANPIPTTDGPVATHMCGVAVEAGLQLEMSWVPHPESKASLSNRCMV